MEGLTRLGTSRDQEGTATTTLLFSSRWSGEETLQIIVRFGLMQARVQECQTRDTDYRERFPGERILSKVLQDRLGVWGRGRQKKLCKQE